MPVIKVCGTKMMHVLEITPDNAPQGQFMERITILLAWTL